MDTMPMKNRNSAKKLSLSYGLQNCKSSDNRQNAMFFIITSTDVCFTVLYFVNIVITFRWSERDSSAVFPSFRIILKLENFCQVLFPYFVLLITERPDELWKWWQAAYRMKTMISRKGCWCRLVSNHVWDEYQALTHLLRIGWQHLPT